MEPLALLGLVSLLLIKEAGLPIPVPGDLLVIGAGAALAADGPAALGGLAAILGAGYLGGTLQFTLMRRAVRRPLLRMLERVGVSPQRIDSLADRLRRSGSRGVAVTRMTPGVRIGSIAASGLADLPLPVFVRGLVIGNTIFVTAHFGLGFALGASATSVLGGGVPAALIALVIGLLAVVGAVGWTAMRARRRTRSVVRSGPFPGWAEAACPACLAVTTFRDEPGG